MRHTWRGTSRSASATHATSRSISERDRPSTPRPPPLLRVRAPTFLAPPPAPLVSDSLPVLLPPPLPPPLPPRRCRRWCRGRAVSKKSVASALAPRARRSRPSAVGMSNDTRPPSPPLPPPLLLPAVTPAGAAPYPPRVSAFAPPPPGTAASGLKSLPPAPRPSSASLPLPPLPPVPRHPRRAATASVSTPADRLKAAAAERRRQHSRMRKRTMTAMAPTVAEAKPMGPPNSASMDSNGVSQVGYRVPAGQA